MMFRRKRTQQVLSKTIVADTDSKVDELVARSESAISKAMFIIQEREDHE
jgi:hypothetical protein